MILVINNNINNLYCIIYKQSHVKKCTSQRGGTSKGETKRDRRKKNVCMRAGEKENSTV